MFLAEQINIQEVDKLHYWLEIGYFISGIVVAGVGSIALWQLKLAKENLEVAGNLLKTAKTDIQLRIKRESIVLAAQQSEKFAEQIVPQAEENLTLLVATGLTTEVWTFNDSFFNETSIKEWKSAKEWAMKIEQNEKAKDSVFTILNKLEAFAIYFAKGAADEQVVFPSVATPFCGLVNVYAPFLILIRMKGVSGVASGAFQNIVDLHKTWSARIKRESLEIEASLHESEASRSRHAADNITVSSIRPVGTEE